MWWRYRLNKLINLMTRNQPKRLEIQKYNMNPYSLNKIPKLDIQEMYQKYERKLQKETIPYNLEQLYNNNRDYISSYQQIPFKKDQIVKVNLNIILFDIRNASEIQIPLLTYIADQVLQFSLEDVYKYMSNIQAISNALNKRIQKQRKSLKSFILYESLVLISQIQTLIYRSLLITKNRIKLKKISYKLMILNKQITKLDNENFKTQLYWVLQYGSYAQKSRNNQEAYKYYQQVFNSAPQNFIYKTLALKSMCRCLSSKSNLSELELLLKQSIINKNEQHRQIILETMSKVESKRRVENIIKEIEQQLRKQKENLQKWNNSFKDFP